MTVARLGREYYVRVDSNDCSSTQPSSAGSSTRGRTITVPGHVAVADLLRGLADYDRGYGLPDGGLPEASGDEVVAYDNDQSGRREE